MIPVTKPYLPNRKKLDALIGEIYERNWLTNNGPLVQTLTARLEEYLGVENLLLVANGTLALQIAYHALNIHEPVDGLAPEAVTTPFSFAATASSLRWEGIKPLFADIDPQTWCLDPASIEALITPRTRALVPVHVFGNFCDVAGIQRLADRFGLKVVYDAAHCFGVKSFGKSVLNFGDAATLSFHATKIFHTIEGGAIVFKRKEDLEIAKRLINFGLSGGSKSVEPGVNAKMNEFQAAMGLCVLDEMDSNMQKRGDLWHLYHSALSSQYQLQRRTEGCTNNFGYFPMLLEDEGAVVELVENLGNDGIGIRRYFYPSLDTVECFGSDSASPESQDVARRIVCLPLYAGLEQTSVDMICQKIQKVAHPSLNMNANLGGY